MMIRIIEDENTSTIYDVPSYLTAALLLAVLISVVFGFLLLSNSISFVGSFTLGSILFFTLWFIFNVPITTIKLETKNNFISIKKRSLTKTTQKNYAFEEILGAIYLAEIKQDEGEYIYPVILTLRSGEKVTLFQTNAHNRAKYYNAVNSMNDIIFDSDFKLSAFNEI